MKKVLTVIIICTVFFSSCAKKKTEEELYKDLTSSFPYKTYKTVSSTLLPVLAKQYNDNAGAAKVTTEEARVFLAYFWASSNKSIPAFAESNMIIDNEGSSQILKYLAHMVRAMACVNMKMPVMAKKELETAKALFDDPEGGYSEPHKQALFHLIIAIACVYNDEYEVARFHMLFVSQLTGILWPYQLIDGAFDVKEGRVQEGLIKIKELSENPEVPEEARALIKEHIAEIEKTSGPVESRLFWVRAIGSVVFKDLKNATSEEVKKLHAFVDDLTRRLAE